MRAVVVQHEAHEGPGLLAPALTAAGFELEHRHREVLPIDFAAELVVVLGGPMDAFDERLAYLTAEVALLRHRLAHDLPCLGICLGAQLLARAAGAVVARGARGLEVGALPVTCTAAGRQDPVTGPLDHELLVAMWHRDTFGLPAGAVHLLRSARYEQQAFRLGRSYGLQFHLELDAPTLARWLADGSAELAAAGIDATAIADLGPFVADAARRAAFTERLVRALQP
ncbi:MAG: gamma-glutamyl-gamma-aminobutyrate hydrolase family protein [Planctomycetes bacterium]|nr:gamma-glutamyl-gamma-aminobutyrate hydrolase family protein [Planctomycetota bacterium]